MDLANLDNKKTREDGVPVDIRHPVSGKLLGLRIWVASQDSERVTSVRNQLADERIQDMRETISAQEQTAYGERLLAAAIVRWEFSDDLTIDGGVPDCTPENAQSILRRFPFVADQVAKKSRTQSAFFSS